MFNKKAFAISLGLIYGLGMVVLTLLAMSGIGLGLVSMYTGLLPGYSVSLFGMVVGFLYAFILGGIFGYIFAGLYNHFE